MEETISTKIQTPRRRTTESRQRPTIWSWLHRVLQLPFLTDNGKAAALLASHAGNSAGDGNVARLAGKLW
jgi:hypothetical protein